MSLLELKLSNIAIPNVHQILWMGFPDQSETNTWANLATIIIVVSIGLFGLLSAVCFDMY